jgi:hypothetical protein
MTSRTLLNNLEPYWVFLGQLNIELSESTGTKYTSKLQQAYSFIILELEDEDHQQFLQIRYQIQSKNKLSIYDLYCDDKKIEAKLEAKANQLLVNFEWNTPAKQEFELKDKQVLYLEIADRIAAVGNDIFAEPSFYSLVTLTANAIKLDQINGQNSRSIDHKDSYFLRELSFSIPLKDQTDKTEKSKAVLIDGYLIGDMEILFGDSSAKSQRATGDQIRLQLQEEIKNYQ